MASLLNMSGRLLNFRPYDAEIEYLESTGTQWIDADVSVYHPTDSFTIETNTSFTDNSHRALMGTNPWMYFGVSSSKQFEVNQAYVRNYDNNFHLWKLIHTNINGSNGNRKAFIDDKNVKDFNVTYSTNVKSYNYWILFYAVGSNIKMNAQLPAAQIIKNGKITKNNVIVRDFIPVRVGQVGYMYDKVSGKLFGNNGTGSFILGADKTN